MNKILLSVLFVGACPALATDYSSYSLAFGGKSCEELQHIREKEWDEWVGRADNAAVPEPKEFKEVISNFWQSFGNAVGNTRGSLNNDHAEDAWQDVWKEKGCGQ